MNSFAIFFCSLMPKQRARLHLGRLPGNREVVIGLYIGAMVYIARILQIWSAPAAGNEELTGKTNQKRRNILVIINFVNCISSPFCLND